MIAKLKSSCLEHSDHLVQAWGVTVDTVLDVVKFKVDCGELVFQSKVTTDWFKASNFNIIADGFKLCVEEVPIEERAYLLNSML